MSSLQVKDHRRTRSKSPGGRIREHSRSRSRDGRAPSPGVEKLEQRSKKFYDPDSEEDNRSRYSARHEPAQKYPTDALQKYSKSSAADEDRVYREQRNPPGHFYGSDSEGERRQYRKAYRGSGLGSDSAQEREPRYISRQKPPASQSSRYYSDDSDDSFTESDDEDLAYGDGLAPSSRQNGWPTAPLPPGSMSRGRPADGLPSQPSTNPIGHPDQFDRGPGGHPSYAQPNRFNYAQPAPFAPQPTNFQPPTTAGYATAPPLNPLPPDWAPIPDCERPDFVPPGELNHAQPGTAFPPPNITSGGYASTPFSASAGAARAVSPRPTYATVAPQQYVNPPYNPGTPVSPTGTGHYGAQHEPDRRRAFSSGSVPQHQYANPAPFQYAQPDQAIKYANKAARAPYSQGDKNQFVKSYTASADPQFKTAEPQTRGYTATTDPQFVEIRPGGRSGLGGGEGRNRPHSLSVSSATDHLGAMPGSFGRPPASPLLEAYKGTYQSISPMPSPMMMPSGMDEGLSDLEPLDRASDSDRRKKGKSKKGDKKDKAEKKEKREKKEKKDKKDKDRDRLSDIGVGVKGAAGMQLMSPTTARSKRVSFYDPTPDAKALQGALSHSRVDSKPFLAILPYLTTDELLELRTEYKNHAKLSGKGINIAKHIKLKIPGSFGKVCYATALGRWESEAHWANSYYQSGTSRRELLIESLMGRTNAEIREIKSCFKDKKYDDNLERCMKAALKADKFRHAVLLALEEDRQSENAPLRLDIVHRDVQDLHRALLSRDGGETAMIEIIVVRSDAHLREVLHVYEATYRQNFAREMIAKSRNLVGETLAHILNGALNRPMRDALLLHQAVAESGTGRDRAELLISRLVRLHWEPRHLERVKAEYRKRYGERIETAIHEEVMEGGRSPSEWGEFCVELCRSSSFHAGAVREVVKG